MPVTKQIDAQSVFDAAATSGMTNVSVTISANPPSIAIIKPGNKTYESNTSITLEIEVTNTTSAVDRLFYNLDKGANTTLTLIGGGNIHFCCIFRNTYVVRIC